MEAANAISTLLMSAAGIAATAHVAIYMFWQARRASEML